MATPEENHSGGPVAAPDIANIARADQHEGQPETGKCGQMVNSARGAKDGHTSVSSDFQSVPERQSERTGDDETASLDQTVQSAIGQQLRAMFDEIAKEPVPERFLELLSELEKRQKRR